MISVVPDGLNLRVRAAAPEGECEFLTASFTDTWSLPEGKLIGKSLNAAVRACGDAVSPEIAGFMPGAFPGEGYLRFPVAGDCTYPDAPPIGTVLAESSGGSGQLEHYGNRNAV